MWYIDQQAYDDLMVQVDPRELLDEDDVQSYIHHELEAPKFNLPVDVAMCNLYHHWSFKDFSNEVFV